MKRIALSLCAAAAALPLALGQPAFAEEPRSSDQHYSGKVTYTECQPSSGRTGLAVGGVGGALIGAGVSGGGLLGTLIGAIGGAIAGRAIDRDSTKAKRCRAVAETERYDDRYSDRPAADDHGDLYERGPSER